MRWNQSISPALPWSRKGLSFAIRTSAVRRWWIIYIPRYKNTRYFVWRTGPPYSYSEDILTANILIARFNCRSGEYSSFSWNEYAKHFSAYYLLTTGASWCSDWPYRYWCCGHGFGGYDRTGSSLPRSLAEPPPTTRCFNVSLADGTLREACCFTNGPVRSRSAAGWTQKILSVP